MITCKILVNQSKLNTEEVRSFLRLVTTNERRKNLLSTPLLSTFASYLEYHDLTAGYLKHRLI